MEAGIPARLTFTPRDGRKFAFPVGIAFGVFGAIAYWRHPGGAGTGIAVWMVLEALAVALLAAGAMIPARLGPVYRAWMGLGKALSKVVNPVVMGVMYYLVITPMGLIMRAIGKQPMRHPETNGGFWMSPPSGGRSDMNHQF